MVYRQSYILNAVCIFAICLLLLVYFWNGFDVFDPLVFITAIYTMLYFVAPLYDIVIQKYTWFGYSILQYGKKAAVVALIGYLAFYLLYIRKPTKRFRFMRGPAFDQGYNLAEDRPLLKRLTWLVLVLYLACFAANLFYLVHSGYTSPLYIFTLGFLGRGNSVAENIDSIGFLAMPAASLSACVLMYWECTKKKGITALLIYGMLSMQITHGFRFIVVQILVTFVVYYFISNRRRPRFSQIVVAFIVLMVPVLFMTVFREDIRHGIDFSISGLGLSDLQKAFDDALWDNLRIYNNYYAIVNAVPSRFDYVYGRQIIIGTIVMVIPRLIWPGKISTAAGVGLDQIIGSALKNTGQAYPNLGEFYYALGVVGVVICMAIYGLLARGLRDRYMVPENGRFCIVLFAVLLGANLQVIIRGYTPSNFWYVVFCVLPVLIVKCAIRVGFGFKKEKRPVFSMTGVERAVAGEEA